MQRSQRAASCAGENQPDHPLTLLVNSNSINMDIDWVLIGLQHVVLSQTAA